MEANEFVKRQQRRVFYGTPRSYWRNQGDLMGIAVKELERMLLA
jgi:hypothetical protein